MAKFLKTFGLNVLELVGTILLMATLMGPFYLIMLAVANNHKKMGFAACIWCVTNLLGVCVWGAWNKTRVDK